MEHGKGTGETRTKELGSNKKKRENPSQVQILQDAFSVERLPSVEMMAYLAKRTGLTFEQVQVWFANRRAYDRYAPWGMKSGNKNSNNGLMEGKIVLALPAARAVNSKWRRMKPPQAGSSSRASTESPPQPSEDMQGLSTKELSDHPVD